MRGLATRVAVIGAIVGGAGVATDQAAAEPRAAAEPSAAAVQNGLRVELDQRTPEATPQAKCRRTRRSWTCGWTQEKTSHGWSYSCSGDARLTRGNWRIDPCELAAETAQLGEPHDVIFGFNDDWAERSTDVDFASDAGAEAIRFPLGWNVVQPTFKPSNLLEALLNPGGSWDWSYYDRLYKAAQAQGVDIFLSLQDAPCWSYQAQVNCKEDAGGSAPDAAHLDEMAIFLREAIRRYPGAVAVEIYNEPNLIPFWRGTPDPEYYAELLKVGYEATKSVRPDMPVLFAGLAPVKDTDEKQMNFSEFFTRALDAGAVGHFDALSAHPYFRPFLRRDYIGRVGDHLAELKTTAFKHGFEEMPIWITEMGVSTAGNGAISEAEQAERTEALYSATRRMPQVEAVILHRLFDTEGTGTSEDGWGLVRSDRRVKPAYCAVAGLNERHPDQCG